MLGQMPTAHVAAVLRATPAGTAIGVLLSLPADRVAALLPELTDADLARLLGAGSLAQQAAVLGAAPAEQRPAVLAALPDPAALLGTLPDGDVAGLLGQLPAEAAATAAAHLGERLERLPVPRGLSAAAYAVRVGGAVGRMVPVTADLVATVLGRTVLVVPLAEPDAEQLHAAVLAADWAAVDGLLAVSPREPTERAVAHAATTRAHGYPVDVLRWSGHRDEPALKRALARLAD